MPGERRMIQVNQLSGEGFSSFLLGAVLVVPVLVLVVG